MNVEEILNEVAASLPQTPPSVPQHWVHVQSSSRGIIGFGADPSAADGVINIQVEKEIAQAFLFGEADPSQWILGPDKKLLNKKEIPVAQYNLLDRLELQQLQFIQHDSPDITIVIDASVNKVRLYYSPGFIMSLASPVNFYFTRRGDPTYLKCTAQLDVNILNSIMKHRQSDCWPNFIEFGIEDASDLSIFTHRNFASISIEHQEFIT
jgi:hypothetical protein